MTVKSTGIDILEIDKVKRMRDIPGFYYWFSEVEIKNCYGDEIIYYASRIALKESVFKALNQKIDMRDITILDDANAEPYVLNIKDYDVRNIHLSYSFSENLVVAICVIE